MTADTVCVGVFENINKKGPGSVERICVSALLQLLSVGKYSSFLFLFSLLTLSRGARGPYGCITFMFLRTRNLEFCMWLYKIHIFKVFYYLRSNLVLVSV